MTIAPDGIRLQNGQINHLFELGTENEKMVWPTKMWRWSLKGENEKETEKDWISRQDQLFESIIEIFCEELQRSSF